MVQTGSIVQAVSVVFECIGALSRGHDFVSSNLGTQKSQYVVFLTMTGMTEFKKVGEKSGGFSAIVPNIFWT